MRINGDHNVIPPVGGDVAGPDRCPVKGRRGSQPQDAVEISGPAGAGAHEIRRAGPKNTDTCMDTTLNQVRTRLRERIRNGFYDNEEVLGSIAGTMLDLFGL